MNNQGQGVGAGQPYAPPQAPMPPAFNFGFAQNAQPQQQQQVPPQVPNANVPPPPPMPVQPFVFALTPSQATNTPLNMSDKNHVEIYKQGIEGLPSKYDLQSNNLRLFLKQLSDKSLQIDCICPIH